VIKRKTASGLGFTASVWPLSPGRPTVVFVHGAGGSSVLWHAQVEGLSDRVNAVAIDLPGHGSSPGPGRESIAEYAQVVAGFGDELGLEKPILAGLSMGGAIVQESILTWPDKYRAGILISTGAKLKVMPLIFETIEKDFQAYVQMSGKFAASPRTDPALLAEVMADTATREPKVVLGDFRACDAFDVRERLSELKLPVLVVSGEDDQLTPPKYSDYLESKLPNARRVRIPDAGHLVVVEKAAEVNRAIAEFVKGI
jgi:pimeloyl-ACP methyl ester carboxylesterase